MWHLGRLTICLSVLASMLITSTNSHAASIDINLANFETMMTATITDSLIESALTNTKRTTQVIIDATRPELDKYLSASDAEAVAKRFQNLLSSLIKGGNDEVVRSALKPEIVRNLFKVALNDALKRDKLAEKVEELAKSVNTLNLGIKPKIVLPGKEVEFLFDAVVGDSCTLNADALGNKCEGNQSMHLVADRHYNVLRRYTSIRCVGLDTSTGKNKDFKEIELTSDEATEYKMIAVEKVLGLRTEADETIINRISNAQKQIRNYEWERNHLRFAIMGGYIKQLEALSTSLVLHAYPSYRQYIPGRFDLQRRMSFYIGVGAASKKTADAELRGPVYSYGIGFDIREGIGITVGGSTYTMESTAPGNIEQTHTGITFGVTLNSDLWNALFGNK